MKQICSIVLAAAVLIAAALPGIAADELIYSAQYLGATQSLEISGTAGAAAGKMVILTICARETVPDAQAVTEGLAVAKALHTGEAGAFSAVIGLPDSFASGFYTLYFSGDFSAAPYQFSHMNQGQAERAVAEINRAEELATFTDTVGEQIGAFGLDAAAHQEYGAYVCEVLYAVKPATGYTAEGFFDGYASAVASYFIKYSSQALDQVLAIYSGNIGIDYQKDYNRFSNEIKQNLYMQLKKEDFTKRPFLPIYQEALVLAQVKAAGQYPILAEVILEHAGALGLSLTAYHGLNQSQQAQVFRLMMGDARLNAFSTIKPLFEECISDIAP